MLINKIILPLDLNLKMIRFSQLYKERRHKGFRAPHKTLKSVILIVASSYTSIKRNQAKYKPLELGFLLVGQGV